MIKPKKLNRGDTVAIVSLSSGLAGEADLIWRTFQGIERLEKVFGLKVKVMPNALKGIDYLYEHPEKRAEDFNEAMLDPEIKAVICTIGGTETVRILPYIDKEAVKSNPKILCGYSDTTTNHLFMYQLGISSFYGPALLTDFAENVEMDKYTVDSIERTLFSNQVVGEIYPSDTIRKFGLLWGEENQHIEREKIVNSKYQSINGQGKVKGHLIGGCIETLTNLRGTEVFPSLDTFDGAILFLETSERHTEPSVLESYLRSFAVMGIFDRVNGVIVGRPQDGVYYEEYKEVYQSIMAEWNLENLPVLYNLSFGHNEPKFILPYGVQAEMDADEISLKILENAVE